jgi:hypothetical protein
MKLALIISAIIAVAKSLPVVITSSGETMTVTPGSISTITTNMIEPTTSMMSIHSTIQPTTASMPISSVVYPTTSSMSMSSAIQPSTTKMIATTTIPPTIVPTNRTTTMMPYKNISCFNNEYRIKELNVTIIRDNLMTMINNMGNYTKEFSNNVSNSTMDNELICGTQIAYNSIDNTYNVEYGAFQKSYCDDSNKNLDIICSNNTICNKTISCCQDSFSLADENCNRFYIMPVNDTRNDCIASNISECYSLFRMDEPTAAPTTKVNSGSVISTLKLYLLILISAAVPAININ